MKKFKHKATLIFGGRSGEIIESDYDTIRVNSKNSLEEHLLFIQEFVCEDGSIRKFWVKPGLRLEEIEYEIRNYLNKEKNEN